MEDGSSMADEVYIQRGCLVLEDFLFFSLYSFSCIASNSTTLGILFDSCLCLVLSIRISSSVLQHPHHALMTLPVTLEPVSPHIHQILVVFQHYLSPFVDLCWYFCEETDSYITICTYCSPDLQTIHVPTPFERL